MTQGNEMTHQQLLAEMRMIDPEQIAWVTARLDIGVSSGDALRITYKETNTEEGLDQIIETLTLARKLMYGSGD